MCKIEEILKNRVLVLDGAMGTMLQKYELSNEDFRVNVNGKQLYANGNFDILSINRPDIITDIHRHYLEAGADIISTNTFNSNAISQLEYGTLDIIKEMNIQSCKLAKAIAMQYSTDEKPRFVAGSVGPTSKSASMSEDVESPASRSVDFEDLVSAYSTQIEGIIEGGADLLLFETVFDTLNVKAAIYAAQEVFATIGKELPIMISATVSDRGGRNLSGQTIEAFLASVAHARPLSIGLNCSFGAADMYPIIKNLSNIAPFYISAHPNAGLPDEFGRYVETPESMSKWTDRFISEGIVNIIGGCCGTTPEHIKSIALSAAKAQPRQVPIKDNKLTVCGLEPLSIDENSNFIHVGERCNVAGSLKFAKLIREERYEEALNIARAQVDNGAVILDVNLDDAMIDAKSAMTKFLRLLASEPEIAKVPLMIDASHWDVLVSGMQNIQGRSIVNSISLKEGEEVFLQRASLIRKYGCAVVVMAFDEKGQASNFERRKEIFSRAYKLLTENLDFPGQDIIFDPNVLTICTGIKEHDRYALDFIESVAWIKANLPFAKVSGGISNLSFAFRGNNPLREAMHSVFLYHAIKAGLDMAIVNAGALPGYDDIDSEHRDRIEDAILCRREDATERLLEIADKIKNKSVSSADTQDNWRQSSLYDRVLYAMTKGVDSYIEEDMLEATKVYDSAIDIIELLLMKALNVVGTRFNEGKMFLPQVVKSARVMKKAVEVLEPFIQESKAHNSTVSQLNKIVMATVKGDVHDIGKNIVNVVLGCNNFEVIDLGVMVSAERIVEESIKQKADMIGLSGLITPSLDEMITVVKALRDNHVSVPVFIGGATTSAVHTAVKIAPEADFPVIYSKNASDNARMAVALTSNAQRNTFLKTLSVEQSQLRHLWAEKQQTNQSLTITEARLNSQSLDFVKEPPLIPNYVGTKHFSLIPISELRPFIRWNTFLHTWQINGQIPTIFDDKTKGVEALKLYNDANDLLDKWSKEGFGANGIFSILPAYRKDDDIVLPSVDKTLYCLRNQTKDNNWCLSDFLSSDDYIGLFAVSFTSPCKHDCDDWCNLLSDTLAHRLAEAASEWLHTQVRQKYWGYEPLDSLTPNEILKGHYCGIRPAFGYPSCPDHSQKRTAFDILSCEALLGMGLTENYAMTPSASVCGMYFAHPQSRYFVLQDVGEDQLMDYAQRRNMPIEVLKKLLSF